MLLSLLSALLIAYLMLAFALWALQRRLIFNPPSRLNRAPSGPAAHTYDLHNSHFHPQPGLRLQVACSSYRPGPSVGTILYFGGRSEDATWSTDLSSYAEGWNVVAANYRGFGLSEGSSRQDAVNQDALALFDSLPPSCGPVVLVGRSLGTCVALHVASHRGHSGLVLISPMDSLANVLRDNILTRPFAWLLRDRFECLELASAVRTPTLALLSAYDRRVLVETSMRLIAKIPSPVTLRIIHGYNHCTVHRSQAALSAIASFLNSAHLVPCCRISATASQQTSDPQRKSPDASEDVVLGFGGGLKQFRAMLDRGLDRHLRRPSRLHLRCRRSSSR
jgi:pimeloyl-ACP methyl ester carboxylesterase